MGTFQNNRVLRRCHLLSFQRLQHFVEKSIRNSFKNQLKDSTKIIIAQRISSVIESDTIIVMNDGKITGIGNHEDLLETCEEYKEIYYSQTDKKEE